MDDIDLITTPEAAVILRRSTFTVTRLVREGKLTAAFQANGPNGAYFFARAIVEAFRDERDRKNQEVRRATAERAQRFAEQRATRAGT